MGSTTHIVDETGEVQNRYAYDAWGNLTLCEEKISNRFKFTGQQLDPLTQQYYLRARFYNPVIARFTQEDTYRGDGLNLYAYCVNNPVNYIDPTGNEKDTLGERYRQQEIDNYVANKRAGLDTGDVPPEIVAQGNAAIKALEAIDKQLGYSKQNPATGETNRSANRVAPQADVPSASNKMEGGSHSRWWHENYVDNLSDIQILLGVKQSNKGLSTLGSATRETAMAAGKAWVGDQYKEIFDSSGNIIGYSAFDGMRAFRIQYKPKEGMYRANFQENMMVSNPFPNRGEHRSELKNVHIDILD